MFRNRTTEHGTYTPHFDFRRNEVLLAGNGHLDIHVKGKVIPVTGPVWPRGWVEWALEGSEWSAARPGRTLPLGKTRYPFYRRLGGPQGRSGRAENLVPTGIRSRTVQPVISRHTCNNTKCREKLTEYKMYAVCHRLSRIRPGNSTKIDK